MQDIEQSILTAWQKIRPTLLDDDHALAQRLARRRRPLLTRPPRAWCLAIRASDTRLPSPDLPSPCHPLTLTPCHPPKDRQQIHLTTKTLRRLCCPVTIDPPGQTLREVAA